MSLCFEDDESGSSPGWFGNAAATYCPDRPSQKAAEIVSKHSDTYAAPLCISNKPYTLEPEEKEEGGGVTALLMCARVSTRGELVLVRNFY